jgi:16S rRNA (cytidine1402-2'-O)-methyltransferase
MLALMASGMSGQRFTFHGYLPIKQLERQKKLRLIEQDSKQQASAHLWIETPYRNTSMFTSLTEDLQPNTQLCIAIDLTLDTEQVIRQTISQWKKAVQSKPAQLPQDLDKRPAVFILQA